MKYYFWRSNLVINNLFLNTFIIVIISYLIGSIPTAYIAGKIKGINITEKGNKNVGATNAIFLLGKITGIIVLLVDTGKGYLVVWLAILLSDSNSFVPMLAVVFTIIGHSWMFPIGFKGGKGTAALIGALIFLAPLSIPVLLILFIPIASIIVKDTFIGQGIAMFFFSFLMWFWEGNYYWCIFILLITIVYSLRCLSLYLTYFTEKRRYINPIIKLFFKPFMKDY